MIFAHALPIWLPHIIQTYKMFLSKLAIRNNFAQVEIDFWFISSIIMDQDPLNYLPRHAYLEYV